MCVYHYFISGVTLSSDFMTGFCGETEEEHNDTISLMKHVKFDMAYMFAFSMRKVWKTRYFTSLQLLFFIV